MWVGRHSTTAAGFLPAFLLLASAATAQETRGNITGRVLDPQGAAVVGAAVVVTHLDTNGSTHLTTNETGYYEARLLMPGAYEISAALSGFKTTVRKGVVLSVAAEIQIDLALELGGVSEIVSVTAEAPVLEMSAAAEGGLMDNESITQLPVLGNNAMLLAKLVPGVQTDGENNYLGLHSISGGSNYYTPGRVGGNEWSIDGVPNQGGSRQAAYLPHSDTVQEFRVENAGFDVSKGRGTGMSINVISKAGTNQYHGTFTEQHWQQRFNGTPFFVKQLYYRNIAAAEAAGDHAQAERLRNSPKQPSGHSNIYSASFGGPVVIPKVYNGRNKLFSLFSFSGYLDRKTEDADNINITLPSMANRQGDFSRLLQVNATKYQVYDPLSVRRDTSRSGTHYVRDPFPGNILPQSRMINPIYNAYVKLLPVPNNEPLEAGREPLNNYLAVGTPYDWNYRAFNQRVDYLRSEQSRFFVRWSYNNFLEDRQDWTYDTVRGLHTGGLNRKNLGATLDWTFTPGSRTVYDFALAANQYRSGNIKPVPMSYRPSDVGFPKYMDDLAGDRHILPQVRVSGYKNIGPDRVPSYSTFRMYSARLDVSHVRGKHTLRAGADTRQHFRTGEGTPSYGTSGRFEFQNYYTRCCDDTALYTPGDLGLSWASFFLGIPRYMRISTSNASYAMQSPYYGGYAQDNWRLGRRLSLNAGFRLEYELAPTERYDRLIGYWDPDARLPFSDLAEAAYARDPAPGLDPAQFKIHGGTVFPGVGGLDRHTFQPELMWMPRGAFAWQIGRRTVVRGGYGKFYDTLNVLNNSPDQTGYTRNTQTPIDNNSGMTWRVGNPAAGISPLADPFPLKPDGTRVLQPLLPAKAGEELVAFAGQRFEDYYAFDTRRARVHRWRVSAQHQLSRTMVVEAAYAGAYGSRIYIDSGYQRNYNALPAQYWSEGLVRAVSSPLTTNVPNPFNIANLAALRETHPAVYDELAGLSWFTDTSRQRQQLLRPFPHMDSLVTQLIDSSGKLRTAALELTFRRYARGFTLTAGYTGLRNKTADWYSNQSDTAPSWRLSNNGRPHRLTATGVYQLPVGRRRALLRHGLLSRVLGGFQVAGTYEFQPGPLLDFGNVFYYGDPAALSGDLKADQHTLDQWFNTPTVKDWYARNMPGANPCYVNSAGERAMPRSAGMGFESCSAYAPDSGYNRRTFPLRVDGLRSDATNQINANVQREFRVGEKTRLWVRFDALNLTNRSRFKAPTTDPVSTNFGRITEQSAALNRFLQVQARLQF